MAKKTKTTGRTKAARTAKSKTAASAKAPGAKALLALEALPPDRQASLFRAIESAIKQERVSGTLTSLHFENNDFGVICDPGKVRRTVCRTIRGRVVCAPECVDP